MQTLKTPSPPAVDRAFAILEEVARSNRGVRLPELALRLQIPKSSAHSLLVALERQGYLERDESSRRYMLGAKVLGLANVALLGNSLRAVSAPLLRQLMRSTDLVVNTAVLDHGQAVLIEQIAPPFAVAQTNWLGKRLDMHCTALGKILAACHRPDEWPRIARAHGLARHNANTICTPEAYLQEIERVRDQGFAEDNEEVDLGVRCLAVPVLNPVNGSAAAISLCGSTSEIHDGNKMILVGQLRQAALRIEEALRAKPEAEAS